VRRAARVDRRTPPYHDSAVARLDGPSMRLSPCPVRDGSCVCLTVKRSLGAESQHQDWRRGPLHGSCSVRL